MNIYHSHHIIPQHLNGPNNSENLIKLTIPEHAAWHYELWAYYGFREDYIAWKALSGQIGKEEILHEMFKIIGKKTGLNNKGLKRLDVTNYKHPKKQNHKEKLQKHLHTLNNRFHATKNYIAISPIGQTELVFHLKDFCIEKQISYSGMKAVSQGKQKHHKGWFIYKNT